MKSLKRIPLFSLALRESAGLRSYPPQVLLSEIPLHGTYETVKARFWPWHSGSRLEHVMIPFLYAWKRLIADLIRTSI